jgi:hypothetical protein
MSNISENMDSSNNITSDENEDCIVQQMPFIVGY